MTDKDNKPTTSADSTNPSEITSENKKHKKKVIFIWLAAICATAAAVVITVALLNNGTAPNKEPVVVVPTEPEVDEPIVDPSQPEVEPTEPTSPETGGSEVTPTEPSTGTGTTTPSTDSGSGTTTKPSTGTGSGTTTKPSTGSGSGSGSGTTTKPSTNTNTEVGCKAAGGTWTANEYVITPAVTKIEIVHHDAVTHEKKVYRQVHCAEFRDGQANPLKTIEDISGPEAEKILRENAGVYASYIVYIKKVEDGTVTVVDKEAYDEEVEVVVTEAVTGIKYYCANY